MERFLGGQAPRQQRRALTSIERELAGISKLSRQRLSASETNKLKQKAETGLENKFIMMEPLVGSKASRDQLKSIYSVTMRIEEYRKSLQAYDMDDVFTIASEYEQDPNTQEFHPTATAEPINLFTQASEVDLETIRHASEYMSGYGQRWMLQNLLWSGAKLLNSCDDKLRQKIEEKTLGWSVDHSTGPVYFKIMLDNILASSPESMRGLTTTLQDTKLNDFDGENVVEYVSFMRGAIEQLRNNNALPVDVLSIVANALKHCETDDFVSYVNTMYNNHLQGVKACTVDDLLLKVEKEYVVYVSAKKWKAKMATSDESVFFIQGVYCYGCGKEGHVKKDCTEKGSSTPDSQGRGGRGRSQRGRGRGGRGRGRGTSRGQYEKDKTPPKAGESHTRQKNGVTQKWCGIDGYWTWGNRAHETKDCPNKKEKAMANIAEQGSQDQEGSGNGTGGDSGSNRQGFGGLAFVTHAADF